MTGTGISKNRTKRNKKAVRLMAAALVLLGSGSGAIAQDPLPSQTDAWASQAAEKVARAAKAAAVEREEAKTLGFHFVGHRLAYESERAEICLETSEPLPVAERDVLASSIGLVRGRTRVFLAPTDLSLTPRDLCVQGLVHGETYKLEIKRLKSAAGAALVRPFSVSFDVPHRKAFLAFEEGARGDSLLRLSREGGGPLPKLRAINVAAARLELYRVADPNLATAVWQKRAQIGLAPTESLTFARDNGQKVWQGELVFGDKPDSVQKLAAPLPSLESLKDGIYFLAVMPKEPVHQDGTAVPLTAVFAGSWFGVSDVDAEAVRDGAGVRVQMGEAALKDGAASVRLLRLSGELVAETQVEPSALGGKEKKAVVSLAVSPGYAEESLLLSVTGGKGGVALREVEALPAVPAPTQLRRGFLVMDRSVYAPLDFASVMALPRGDETRGSGGVAGVVRLMRPDGAMQSETRIEAGAARIEIPAFAHDGAWRLIWLGDDGEVWAEKKLAVRRDAGPLTLELSPDRPMIDAREGVVGANLKLTQNVGGKVLPLPWRVGHVTARFVPLELAAWPRFSFGAFEPGTSEKINDVSFLTGEDGVARVLVRDLGHSNGGLAVTYDKAARAVSLSADVKDGSVEGGPHQAASLPVRGEFPWVGLRPLGKGTEEFVHDGEAVFEVISLEPGGKRRSAAGLYYQLYEEGRSFAWRQGEGHWDYTPLPRHRRVHGGYLSLSDKEAAVLRLPVSAGYYILEMADAEGHVLARRSFVAGGSLKMVASRAGEPKQDSDAGLMSGQGDIDVVLPRSVNEGASFVVPVSVAKAGKAVPKLAKGEEAPKWRVAAMTTPLQPVDGKLASGGVVAPVQLDADGKASLRVVAPSGAEAVQVRVVAWSPTGRVEKTATIPVRTGVKVEATVPSWMAVGDMVPLRFRVSNDGNEEQTLAYEIEAPEGGLSTDKTKGRLVVPKGQSRVVSFRLNVASGTGGIVRFAAASAGTGVRVERTWPLRVAGSLTVPAFVENFRVAAGASHSWPEQKRGFVAPVPLGDVGGAVATAAFARPSATREIVAWLEAMQDWARPLVDAGLENEKALGDVREGLWRHVRLLQREDGGVAAWPGAEPDIASTAAALRVFRLRDRVAAVAAAQWLRQRLENVWFDEGERSARAEAFLSLALMDRDLRRQTRTEDPAAARYFMETSRDKEISVLVAAKIARAMVASGDEESAREWSKRARDRLAATMQDMAQNEASDVAEIWSALATLAANPVVPSHELWPLFEEAYRVTPRDAQRREVVAVSLLRAVAALAVREETWRIGMTKPDGKTEERKAYGILAPVPGLRALSNPGKADLFGFVFASEVEEGDKGAKAQAFYRVQSQLYTLDGEKIEGQDALDVGGNYILVVRGDKAKEGSERGMLVDVSLASGVEPVTSAAAPMEAFAAQYPWLSSSLTQPSHAALFEDRAVFEFDKSADWRVAILVRATQAGSFAVPLVRLTDASGALLPVEATQGRVRVR